MIIVRETNVRRCERVRCHKSATRISREVQKRIHARVRGTRDSGKISDEL